MDIPSFLKDFMWESPVEEPKEQPKQKSTVVVNGVVGYEDVGTGVAVPVAATATARQMDSEKFIAPLRAKLKTASQYQSLESFMSTVDSLAEFITNEEQRFKATAKQLSKSGITRDVLYAACEQSLQVLDKENDRFTAVMQKQTEEEVGSRELKLADLKRQIATATEQHDVLAAEIIEKRAVIASARTNFSNASKALREETNDIIRRVKLYLQETTHG